MELILWIAGILGLIPTIWFLYDKFRLHIWKKPEFKRTRTYVSDAFPEEEESNEFFAHGKRVHSVEGVEPRFPPEVIAAVGKAFPAYRLPTAADMRDDWAYYGDPDRLAPYYCSGDFLGSGKTDHALIILRNRQPGYKVVVLTHLPDGEVQPIELFESDESFQNMYVRTIKPGRYQTIDQPKVLRLRRDGINSGMFESSDSVYYWDKRKKKFVQVWMSD